MRKLLTLAIPIVMGVGLLTAVLNDPEDGQQLGAPREQGGSVTETTLPAVIETPAGNEPETTTTTAAPTTTTTAAPAPAPTTSTTVRFVSAPAPRPAPRPATRPATTPTTAAPEPTTIQTPAPEPVDCGTGSAKSQASYRWSGSAYIVSVDIENNSSKEIELDSLVVEAKYGGQLKQFRANVAGRRVGTFPNNVVTFELAESTSATPPDPNTLVISEFRFHTAGLPECTSRDTQ